MKTIASILFLFLSSCSSLKSAALFTAQVIGGTGREAASQYKPEPDPIKTTCTSRSYDGYSVYTDCTSK